MRKSPLVRCVRKSALFSLVFLFVACFLFSSVYGQIVTAPGDSFALSFATGESFAIADSHTTFTYTVSSGTLTATGVLNAGATSGTFTISSTSTSSFTITGYSGAYVYVNTAIYVYGSTVNLTSGTTITITWSTISPAPIFRFSTNQILYFRSDTQTNFNVTAYRLANENSGTNTSVSTTTGAGGGSSSGAFHDVFWPTPSGTDAALSFNGTDYSAQSFVCTSNYTVTNITVPLAKFEAKTVGTMTLSIRAADLGTLKPTGADLTNGTKNGDSLPLYSDYSSFTNVTFDVTAYNLTQDSKYALVLKAPSSNTIVEWAATTGDAYGDGLGCWSGDSGSTWSVITGSDGKFALFGELVVPAGSTTVTYGFRAWLVGTTAPAELTTGTPATLYTLTTDTTGYQNTTWAFDGASVYFGYQAIKLTLYTQTGSGNWTAIADYISDILLTSTLEPCNWEFNLYIDYNSTISGATSIYSFGSSAYHSSMGLNIKAPTEAELEQWRLNRQDFWSFLVGPYVDMLGGAFFAIIFLMICAVMYFRYGHIGPVLMFFLLFVAADGLIFVLLPPFVAGVFGLIFILGFTFLLWRVIPKQ